MGSIYCIGKVTIFNRVDCCKERLTGAVVRIGIDSNKINNAICGTVTSSMIYESAKLEVLCAIPGRYISIHLPGKNVLTLCEVQAFADECGKSLSLCDSLAENSSINMSQTNRNK